MLNNLKFLLVLMILAAVSVYFVVRENRPATTTENKWLLPQLQNNSDLISQLKEINLYQNEESINMVKTDGEWVLNDGFFVSMNPLFGLLQSLKNAQIIEKKTANPENHAQLDLAANDLRVELKTEAELIAVLHIGKKGSATNSIFVRMADNDQTYLVQGIDGVTFNLDSWKLKTVFDYPANQINQIKIKHISDDSESLEIIRNTETSQFQLAEIPEGFKLRDNANLDQLASVMARFMIDEALTQNVSGMDHLLKHTHVLSSGSSIDLNVYKKDEDHYMTIDSDRHKKYQGWMFKIAEYKFNSLNKKLSDFIESSDADEGENPVDGEVKS